MTKAEKKICLILGTKCGDCGQRFKDYVDLMEHMEKTHLRINADDEVTVIPSGPSLSISSMSKTVQSSQKAAQLTLELAQSSSQVSVHSSSVSKPEDSTSNSLDDDDLVVVMECINKKNNNPSNKNKEGLNGKSQDGLKNKSQVQQSNVSISPVALNRKSPQSSRVKTCFTSPTLTITKISNGTQGQKRSGNDIAKRSSQEFASGARPNTTAANSTLNKNPTPMPSRGPPSRTPNSSPLTSNLSRQSQSSPGSKSKTSTPSPAALSSGSGTQNQLSSTTR